MFQNGEKISEPGVVNSIKEAREAIDGISSIFDKTPIPNHPELDCRLVSEETYICKSITLIMMYSLRDTNVKSPVGDFQKVDEEFKKFFSSLQNLENIVDQHQEPIQRSNQADDPLRRSGT
jgi:hypothetical protein